MPNTHYMRHIKNNATKMRSLIASNNGNYIFGPINQPIIPKKTLDHLLEPTPLDRFLLNNKFGIVSGVSLLALGEFIGPSLLGLEMGLLTLQILSDLKITRFEQLQRTVTQSSGTAVSKSRVAFAVDKPRTPLSMAMEITWANIKNVEKLAVSNEEKQKQYVAIMTSARKKVAEFGEKLEFLSKKVIELSEGDTTLSTKVDALSEQFREIEDSLSSTQAANTASISLIMEKLDKLQAVSPLQITDVEAIATQVSENVVSGLFNMNADKVTREQLINEAQMQHQNFGKIVNIATNLANLLGSPEAGNMIAIMGGATLAVGSAAINFLLNPLGSALDLIHASMLFGQALGLWKVPDRPDPVLIALQSVSSQIQDLGSFLSKRLDHVDESLRNIETTLIRAANQLQFSIDTVGRQTLYEFLQMETRTDLIINQLAQLNAKVDILSRRLNEGFTSEFMENYLNMREVAVLHRPPYSDSLSEDTYRARSDKAYEHWTIFVRSALETTKTARLSGERRATPAALAALEGDEIYFHINGFLAHAETRGLARHEIIVNPIAWYSITDTFMQLLVRAPELEVNRGMRKQIENVAKVGQDFITAIKALKTNKNLFLGLINDYEAAVNRFIDAAYTKVKIGGTFVSDCHSEGSNLCSVAQAYEPIPAVLNNFMDGHDVRLNQLHTNIIDSETYAAVVGWPIIDRDLFWGDDDPAHVYRASYYTISRLWFDYLDYFPDAARIAAELFSVTPTNQNPNFVCYSKENGALQTTNELIAALNVWIPASRYSYPVNFVCCTNALYRDGALYASEEGFHQIEILFDKLKSQEGISYLASHPVETLESFYDLVRGRCPTYSHKFQDAEHHRAQSCKSQYSQAYIDNFHRKSDALRSAILVLANNCPDKILFSDENAITYRAIRNVVYLPYVPFNDPLYFYDSLGATDFFKTWERQELPFLKSALKLFTFKETDHLSSLEVWFGDSRELFCLHLGRPSDCTEVFGMKSASSNFASWTYSPTLHQAMKPVWTEDLAYLFRELGRDNSLKTALDNIESSRRLLMNYIRLAYGEEFYSDNTMIKLLNELPGEAFFKNPDHYNGEDLKNNTFSHLKRKLPLIQELTRYLSIQIDFGVFLRSSESVCLEKGQWTNSTLSSGYPSIEATVQLLEVMKDQYIPADLMLASEITPEKIFYYFVHNDAEKIERLRFEQVDLNAQNWRKETALILATKQCDVQVIHALISEGVDVNLRDKDAKAAIDYLFFHCKDLSVGNQKTLFQALLFAQATNTRFSLEILEKIQSLDLIGQNPGLIEPVRRFCLHHGLSCTFLPPAPSSTPKPSPSVEVLPIPKGNGTKEPSGQIDKPYICCHKEDTACMIDEIKQCTRTKTRQVSRRGCCGTTTIDEPYIERYACSEDKQGSKTPTIKVSSLASRPTPFPLFSILFYPFSWVLNRQQYLPHSKTRCMYPDFFEETPRLKRKMLSITTEDGYFPCRFENGATNILSMTEDAEGQDLLATCNHTQRSWIQLMNRDAILASLRNSGTEAMILSGASAFSREMKTQFQLSQRAAFAIQTSLYLSMKILQTNNIVTPFSCFLLSEGLASTGIHPGILRILNPLSTFLWAYYQSDTSASLRLVLGVFILNLLSALVGSQAGQYLGKKAAETTARGVRHLTHFFASEPALLREIALDPPLVTQRAFPS